MCPPKGASRLLLARVCPFRVPLFAARGNEPRVTSSMSRSDDETDKMVKNSWTPEVRRSSTRVSRRASRHAALPASSRRTVNLLALDFIRPPGAEGRGPLPASSTARFLARCAKHRPLTLLLAFPPQEDDLLREQIRKLGGPGNWTAIAEALDGRSSKSCRLRCVRAPAPPLAPLAAHPPPSHRASTLSIDFARLCAPRLALIARRRPRGSWPISAFPNRPSSPPCDSRYDR